MVNNCRETTRFRTFEDRYGMPFVLLKLNYCLGINDIMERERKLKEYFDK